MSSYINLSSCGSLEIITGCMFSKKSGKLLNRLGEYAAAGITKVCLVLSLKDSRNFLTRDAVTLNDMSKTNIKTIKCLSLDEKVLNELNKYDVVGIDELHLYDNAANGVLDLLYKKKKTIIVACIDGDYNQEMPSCVTKIIPHCVQITKSNKAICHECLRIKQKNLQHMTKIATTSCLINKTKAIENKVATPVSATTNVVKKDKILVGDDIYEARCPEHIV